MRRCLDDAMSGDEFETARCGWSNVGEAEPTPSLPWRPLEGQQHVGGDNEDEPVSAYRMVPESSVSQLLLSLSGDSFSRSVIRGCTEELDLPGVSDIMCTL